MAQYIGFSTINACQPKSTNLATGSAGGPGGIRSPVVFGNKYAMVDAELVIRDFLNAVSIRQGQKVGNPGYGCKIWDILFDPNSADTQFLVQNEITRIANSDPRINLNFVKTYPYENGILVEVEFAVNPFNQAEVIKLNFNGTTNNVSLV